MTRSIGLAGLFVSISIACACGASSENAPPTTPAPPEVRPEDRTQAESADYEVHEWGLVRSDVDDTLQYGVVAPRAMVPMAVDKPLLYFHATAPLTLRSVRVEPRSGGTLIETWPLAGDASGASWENVSIDPSGPCEPSPLPTTSQPPCVGLPTCEASMLMGARVADAACVRVGSSVERFLFYRGRATSFTPPLTFERTGEHVVRVTNEGETVIPGMLVRIRSEMGRTQTLVAAPPPPHRSVDVGDDYAAAATDHDVDGRFAASDMPVAPATGPGRQSLMESMLAIGLSQSEADAFMAAWASALFGPPIAIDDLTDGDPGPRDSFVYFLPASALENVAHVELSPPPSRGFHRAIAMWSTLRASGVSH